MDLPLFFRIGISRVAASVILLILFKGRPHGLDVLAPDAAGKVVPGDVHHSAGQCQHAEEVRDHHQAVEGVGEVPRKTQLHGRAHDGHADKDDLIDAASRRAEEILHGLGAVVAPAEGGGVGEQQDGLPCGILYG